MAAEKKLSADEVAKLGLDREEPVSPEEVAKLELEAPPAKSTSMRDFLVQQLKQHTPLGAVPTSVKDGVGAGLSFLSGLTLNAAPRVHAGFEAAGATPAAMANHVDDYASGDRTVGGDAVEIAGTEYDRHLPEWQEIYGQAREEHPVANMVGAIASPNPFGKLGVAGRVAGAVGMGGLASYFGAPIDDVEAQRSDTVDGALLAGGLQAGVEAVVPGGKLLGGALRRGANSMAAKAGGIRGGINNVPQYAGMHNAEAVQKYGSDLLEHDLVPWFGGKAEVANRAGELRQMSGNAQQAVLQQAELSGKPFDYTQAAFDAQDAYRGLNGARPLDEAAEAASGNAKTLVKQVLNQESRTPGSYLGAQDLKSHAYDSMYWGSEPRLAQKLHRMAGGGLRKSLETQVGQAVGPEAEQALVSANQKYGLARTAEDLANDAATREASNRLFGMSEQNSALLGAAAGGAPGAVAAPVASYMGRAYGPAFGARSLQAGSAAAEGGAKVVEKVGSPQATANAAQYLEQYLGVKPEDKDEAARTFFESAAP